MKTFVVAVLAAASLASVSTADDRSAKIEAIESQREKLVRETMPQLEKKRAALRATWAADPRLKEAQASVEAAEKTLRERLQGDQKIQESRQAEETARQSLRTVSEAVAAGNPEVQAHRKDLAAARAKAAEAELQQRLERAKAEFVKRQALQKPELQELATKARTDRTTVPEDRRLAAARQSLDDASAALERKLEQLPEYRARTAAQKAYAEALRESPITKAAAAARTALDAKIASDAAVTAQEQRLKTAAEAERKAAQAVADIERKIAAAGRQAARADATVAAAEKSLAEVRKRAREAVDERAAEQQKAVDDARKAFRTKLDALVAGNDEGRGVYKEISTLEERLEQLKSQLTALRKQPAKPPASK